MDIDIFIIFQIITVILLVMGIFLRWLILWALVFLFSALQIFSSYDVTQIVYYYNQTIYAYSPVVVSTQYSYLSYINIAIFSLGMVLFWYDMFSNPEKRAPKVSDAGKK